MRGAEVERGEEDRLHPSWGYIAREGGREMVLLRRTTVLSQRRSRAGSNGHKLRGKWELFGADEWNSGPRVVEGVD